MRKAFYKKIIDTSEDREGMFSFSCDEKKRKLAEKRHKSHKDK